MTPEEVKAAAIRARAAQAEFRGTGLGRRTAFLSLFAGLLERETEAILAANREDLAAAKTAGLSSAMIDRLALSPKSLAAMAAAVREIAAFPDPLGVMEGRRLANGLELRKVRVGIGVVGFIYESRPNVTIDAIALCLKAGNAVILKGGKEAAQSCAALAALASRALRESGLPEGLVALLDCHDREVVGALVRLNGLVDLVIPRGGSGLIRRVTEESTVPVIKHDAGNCHIFVQATADLEMALSIIENAKVQRPSACNAVESLLVDQAILRDFLPRLHQRLTKHGVELRGCPASRAVVPAMTPATEADWGTEYLDLILSVKAVAGLDEAIAHIARWSSQHTEAIITRDLAAARRFTEEVDSAVVLVNASTRFCDGGEFGLGAEVGISTNRLHARGPMGAESLTTYKFVVHGDGHVRS